jgi:hypothetical protein
MRGVHLNVDEFSPWFSVTSEALHETGITVSATMSASHIRIDTVIETGDGCFGQNGFRKDLPYLHLQYYNGEGRKSKVPPLLSSPRRETVSQS